MQNFNRFLKTRAEISSCTAFLKSNNLIPHGLDCKDFDIAAIAPALGDGDLLDMGADGSFILHNAIRRNLKGRKIGIDLLPVAEHNKAAGAEYYQGDLMNTPFADSSFDFITCLSVIEHEVDYKKFSKEVSRLLKSGGKCYITFDYWNPKVNTAGLKLYGLGWNILDKNEATALINACSENGLQITSDVDWVIQDAVINPSYCSPFAGISYTFGIFSFIKK